MNTRFSTLNTGIWKRSSLQRSRKTQVVTIQRLLEGTSARHTNGLFTRLIMKIRGMVNDEFFPGFAVFIYLQTARCGFLSSVCMIEIGLNVGEWFYFSESRSEIFVM